MTEQELRETLVRVQLERDEYEEEIIALQQELTALKNELAEKD